MEASLYHLETRLVSIWRDRHHKRFKRCLKFFKPIQPRHEFSSVNTNCFARYLIFFLSFFFFEKVLILRLCAFHCFFCLFFIITTFLFDPQLIQNWSLTSIFDPHEKQNLNSAITHFVILKFMFFLSVCLI